jgi:hypothetical protein
MRPSGVEGRDGGFGRALAAARMGVACVGLLALAAACGGKGPKMSAREVDATVVENYCRFVAEGNYKDAYEQCLTAKYRKEATLDAFARAHEKRKAEVGVLQERELVRDQASWNLFSKTKEYQFIYELKYPSKSYREYMVVNDEDGAFRIDGTYHSTAGDTLDFLLW